MKSLRKITNLFFIGLTLCSCFGAEDTRIADIKNVDWKMKNDLFELDVKAGQINSQNGYSNIVIDGKQYNCILGIANGGLHIDLYGDNRNLISFYGDKQMFLVGVYNSSDLIKENNKEYLYSLKVCLSNASHSHWTCQYYDYCVDNSIEYPESLTLYGYAAS